MSVKTAVLAGVSGLILILALLFLIFPTKQESRNSNTLQDVAPEQAIPALGLSGEGNFPAQRSALSEPESTPLAQALAPKGPRIFSSLGVPLTYVLVKNDAKTEKKVELVEQHLPEKIVQESIEIRAPGHRWAKAFGMKEIALQPILAFRITGDLEKQRIISFTLSILDSLGWEKEEYSCYGIREDGSWAIALEHPITEDLGWDLEFEIEGKMKTLVHVDSGEHLSIEVPVESFPPDRKPFLPLTMTVSGNSIEKVAKIERIQVIGSETSDGTESVSFPWGSISFRLPPIEKEVKKENGLFIIDLPAQRQYQAFVNDHKLEVFGGVTFIHDGTPKILSVQNAVEFSGTIHVPHEFSLPGKAEILFVPQGHELGWWPGNTIVSVEPDGSFSFKGQPKHWRLVDKPLALSNEIVVVTQEFFPTSIKRDLFGSERINIGDFHLETWEELACVEPSSALTVDSFKNAQLEAHWSENSVRTLAVDQAKKLENGFIGLFSEEKNGVENKPKIFFASMAGEPYSRVFSLSKDSGCYSEVEQIVYSLTLSWPPLNEGECIEVSWRWKGLLPEQKEMILTSNTVRFARNSFSQEEWNEQKYVLQMVAPISGVALVARVYSKDDDLPDRESFFPLVQPEAVVSFD